MKCIEESQLPENRRRLSRLVKRGSDVLKVKEASRILDLSKPETAKSYLDGPTGMVTKRGPWSLCRKKILK